MNQLDGMLARQRFLEDLILSKENALKRVPEGTLRVCRSGNKVQYYHRTDPKDTNGRYLRADEREIAKKLAQKEYDQRVLACARKEKKAIESYMKYAPNNEAETIYEKYSPDRQALISPIHDTDEAYVRKWEQEEYLRKPIFAGVSEFYTRRGEHVRSKSELIIADLLEKNGIPYRYEAPVTFPYIGTIHPDFTVLNVKERREIYWEHLGMMDDPGYCRKALERISDYEQNGIFPGHGLIMTHEISRKPLNTQLVQKLIDHYLLQESSL